jgi:hypothetical protein
MHELENFFNLVLKQANHSYEWKIYLFKATKMKKCNVLHCGFFSLVDPKISKRGEGALQKGGEAPPK